MWIGLHCLRHNNYFEWSSGDPVLYTNWNRREPNSAGENEDCVMLYKAFISKSRYLLAPLK